MVGEIELGDAGRVVGAAQCQADLVVASYAPLSLLCARALGLPEAGLGQAKGHQFGAAKHIGRLRADTAAISAISIWMANNGDWAA